MPKAKEGYLSTPYSSYSCMNISQLCHTKPLTKVIPSYEVAGLHITAPILVLAITVLLSCHHTADSCYMNSYAWHWPKISERESKKRCQRIPDTSSIRFDIVTSLLLIPLNLVSWTWLKSCHIEFCIPTWQSALQDWVRRAS